MKKFKLATILIVITVVCIPSISYYLYRDPLYLFKPTLEVECIKVMSDLDGDGINDMKDIVEGARKEIENNTKYMSNYYSGGYPPDSEGVCTDVIWRALKNAGFNLKQRMDSDIKENLDNYYRIDKIDPNIDFRRVPNQYIYFKRKMKNMTTEVIPNDKDNLKLWQPGDIVVLTNEKHKRLSHIAIISDRRRKDGVPYIIHNSYRKPSEDDLLMYWYNNDLIRGHFRFNYE